MPGRNSAGKKSRAASAPAPSSRWRANYRNPLDSWELLSAHPTMPRMDLPNGVEIPRHRFIAYRATIPTRNMPHPERFNREGWAVSVTNCGEADPFPFRYVNEKFPTWVAIRTDYRLSCFNKWHLCSPYIWVGMYFTPIEDRRHSRQPSQSHPMSPSALACQSHELTPERPTRQSSCVLLPGMRGGSGNGNAISAATAGDRAISKRSR